MVGIVDVDIINSVPHIGRFWSNQIKGYGVSFYSAKKFHHPANIGHLAVNIEKDELDVLSITTNDTFTMTLDMTQQQNKNAVLSFSINDEDHAYIAFDDIDIE